MEARFPANFEKRSNFTPLEGVIRAGQRRAKRRVFPAFLRGEWRYAVCAVRRMDMRQGLMVLGVALARWMADISCAKCMRRN